jgi:hypothetical protein
MAILYLATNGGLGSFDYGDPSKYGARGVRHDRELSANPSQSHLELIAPGGGGGAKPIIQLPGYGSHAPGANLGGVVIIRISKLV